jgi:superfamily II DNA helicase RecQ
VENALNELYQHKGISRFVIDEAHCVVQVRPHLLKATYGEITLPLSFPIVPRQLSAESKQPHNVPI